MARLFESDPSEREKLRTELASIYGLRSKAVHGNASLKALVAARCYKALDHAIELLRVIYHDRPDLLKERDGTGRSVKVLMG